MRGVFYGERRGDPFAVSFRSFTRNSSNSLNGPDTVSRLRCSFLPPSSPSKRTLLTLRREDRVVDPEPRDRTLRHCVVSLPVLRNETPKGTQVSESRRVVGMLHCDSYK